MTTSEPDPPAFEVPTIANAVLVLLSFLVVTLGFGGAVMTLGDGLSPAVSLVLASVPGCLAGLAIGLAIAGWPLAHVLRHLELPAGAWRWVLVIGFGCGVLDLSLLLLGFNDEPVEWNPLTLALRSTSVLELVLVFVMLVVIVPVVEEILMRGIVLRAIAINWGAIAGIVVSAACFALIHFNWAQAWLALEKGVIFAIATLRTGTLGTSIGVHALANAIVFTLLMLALRGAFGPDATAPPRDLPALGLLMMGAVGLSVVVWGLRHLPVSVPRLAALWALPLAVEPVGGPPPTQRRCPRCGELRRADLERCWFCAV